MGREIVKSNLGACVDAMTLDFPTFTIFYLDRCTISLKSVRIDGIRTSSSLSLSFSSLTSLGISIYEDFVYWTDSSTSSLRRVNWTTTGAPAVEVTQPIRSLFGGVEVVHPNKQPFGKREHVLKCSSSAL